MSNCAESAQNTSGEANLILTFTNVGPGLQGVLIVTG